MRIFESFRYLKGRTLQYRFKIIIAFIIGILLFGVVNFWFSTKLRSSIRAYVTGESLWSKSQKSSVIYLVKYSETRQQSDYDKFLSFIEVPRGDRKARLELDKKNPDYEVARQGFLQGDNNPKDVDDLIFLYRWFKNISYMDRAIKIWAKADTEIDRLVMLGNKIHAQNVTDDQSKALLEDVYATDKRLTVLEKDFSDTLGEGSRGISNILMLVTVTISVLLGVLAVSTALLIGRRAIRLDKAKTEFVSMASHQLRTPLTAINWNAEALLAQESKTKNSSRKKKLQELYSSAQRASKLVSDLLSVSTLDLGTYKSEIVTLDIRKTLNTILKDLESEITQKRIKVLTKIEKNVHKVKLDSRLVSVILENLLTNSIKYTPSGGSVRVEISMKKNNLLLKVSDSGIGIPKSEQSQVFEKLFRAENAKQIDANQTGLGLYITKSMVDKLDGSIRFESTENSGTTFHVKIPVNGEPDKIVK